VGVKKESETYNNTPKRVARMYTELFSGIGVDNEPEMTLFSNSGYTDILALRKFLSTPCVHTICYQYLVKYP
jgi:GTP cyclohydrolase I